MKGQELILDLSAITGCWFWLMISKMFQWTKRFRPEPRIPRASEHWQPAPRWVLDQSKLESNIDDTNWVNGPQSTVIR